MESTQRSEAKPIPSDSTELCRWPCELLRAFGALAADSDERKITQGLVPSQLVDGLVALVSHIREAAARAPRPPSLPSRSNPNTAGSEPGATMGRSTRFRYQRCVLSPAGVWCRGCGQAARALFAMLCRMYEGATDVRSCTTALLAEKVVAELAATVTDGTPGAVSVLQAVFVGQRSCPAAAGVFVRGWVTGVRGRQSESGHARAPSSVGDEPSARDKTPSNDSEERVNVQGCVSERPDDQLGGEQSFAVERKMSPSVERTCWCAVLSVRALDGMVRAVCPVGESATLLWAWEDAWRLIAVCCWRAKPHRCAGPWLAEVLSCGQQQWPRVMTSLRAVSAGSAMQAVRSALRTMQAWLEVAGELCRVSAEAVALPVLAGRVLELVQWASPLIRCFVGVETVSAEDCRQQIIRLCGTAWVLSLLAGTSVCHSKSTASKLLLTSTLLQAQALSQTVLRCFMSCLPRSDDDDKDPLRTALTALCLIDDSLLLWALLAICTPKRLPEARVHGAVAAFCRVQHFDWKELACEWLVSPECCEVMLRWLRAYAGVCGGTPRRHKQPSLAVQLAISGAIDGMEALVDAEVIGSSGALVSIARQVIVRVRRHVCWAVDSPLDDSPAEGKEK